MKKTLIAVVALALSNIAVAGPYSDANNMQKICDGVATYAKAAYIYRADEHGTFSREGLTRNVEGMNANDRLKHSYLRAIEYGHDKATSAQDARMWAWSQCMDNDQP